MNVITAVLPVAGPTKMNVLPVRKKVMQITGILMLLIVPVCRVTTTMECKHVCNATDFARSVTENQRRIV